MCHTIFGNFLYHIQKNCLDFCFLRFNISSQRLVSTLNSIVSPQDPPQCLKSLFRVHSGRFLSYSRKKKISQNDHSLSLLVICCHSFSFVVIFCHSLSLVVPFVVTRCTTRCHSLSLFVICCHSLYHSLSLVVIRCTTCQCFYKQSFVQCLLNERR